MEEIPLRKILMATLLAAALTSPALAADPVKLTDAQMDKVSAGFGSIQGGWYYFLLHYWYGQGHNNHSL